MNLAEEVAHLMGNQLHWDEAERKRQLEAYRSSAEKMMAFGKNGTTLRNEEIRR